MCGFVGIWNLNVLPVNKEVLIAMNNSIKHRGPDDEGYFMFHQQEKLANALHGDDSIPYIKSTTRHIKQFNKQANFSIGFRRLSILDLSEKGHQPMQDDSGRFVIVFNGEVYNYIEIRKELISLGHSFKSETDTEVVLKSYIQWGEDCLHKFNGMWAFVIFDTLKNRLFASRDRFGIKPFYYVYIPNKLFAFASEIKALLKLVSFNINKRAVNDYFVNAVTGNSDYTFFKDISQLKPGFVLRLDQTGHLVKTKYYNPSIKKSKLSFNDAVNKFQNLFTDAIRIRQRTDVPFGYALSGGIDSSSIVCAAANMKNISSDITFSMIYKGRKEDESHYISAVLKQTGFKSKFVSPGKEDFYNDFKRFIYHQEEPFGGVSYYGEYKLRELIAANKVIVSLDGQGADEIVSGYTSLLTYYYWDLLKDFRLLSLKENLTAFKNLNNNTTLFNVTKQLLKYTVKGKNVFSEKKYPYIDFSDFRKDSSSLRYNYSKSFLNNKLAEMLFETSIPEQLLRADKSAMAFSVESRFPFLDFRLVEFVQSLPYFYKINKGKTKYILREALKVFLPKEIYSRKDKIGFAVPVDSIISTEFWDYLIEEIRLNDISFINTGKFLNIYNKSSKVDWKFWKVVSFILWYNAFNNNYERK